MAGLLWVLPSGGLCVERGRVPYEGARPFGLSAASSPRPRVPRNAVTDGVSHALGCAFDRCPRQESNLRARFRNLCPLSRWHGRMCRGLRVCVPARPSLSLLIPRARVPVASPACSYLCSILSWAR